MAEAGSSPTSTVARPGGRAALSVPRPRLGRARAPRRRPPCRRSRWQPLADARVLRRRSRGGTRLMFEGGVVGHQLALGSVIGKPHDYHPARLDRGHHAVAEARVDDVVARAEGERGVGPGRRPGRGAEGPAGERLLLRALALDQILGQLGEEARGKAGLATREEAAAAGVGHAEALPRPRDADVAEAALLLLVPLLEGARVREDALLAADDEDGVVLETLGVVQGHQGDLGLAALEVVLVGVERDRLEELLQWRDLRRALYLSVRVELGCDADQLLEVLDPALGFDRALGSQRVEVAGALQERLEQVRDRSALELGAELLDQLGEAGDRLDGGGPESGHGLGLARHLPDRAAGGIRVRAEPALARVADPAPRRVDDASEADLVGRVDEQLQIGDRVLDLGALVELGPADHLIGQLVADQDVLEHPAVSVGPVEDRD